MVSRSGRLMLLALALAGAPAPSSAREDGLVGFSLPDVRGAASLACWTLPTHTAFGNNPLICAFHGPEARHPPRWEARCEYASGPVFVLRQAGRALRDCDERIGGGRETLFRRAGF